VRQDAATGVTRQDQSDVSYGASLSWYLEDHLQLVAGAADDQFHQRGVNNYSQRSQQFTFALTYRFMGSFAAPGLMPAENLRGPR
jgi:outer membrane scaffolding protein for murein synthesis (MipA/OmpV family)